VSKSLLESDEDRRHGHYDADHDFSIPIQKTSDFVLVSVSKSISFVAGSNKYVTEADVIPVHSWRHFICEKIQSWENANKEAEISQTLSLAEDSIHQTHHGIKMSCVGCILRLYNRGAHTIRSSQSVV
jgi:hypothetical protein